MVPSDLHQRMGSLNPTQRALLQKRLAARRDGADSAPAIRRRTISDPRQLSFNQQRLWFLEQLQPATATYNVPFYCRITGELQVDMLRHAIEAVVARHEVLRTVFVAIKGKPVPMYLKTWSLPFRQADVRGHAAPQAEAERLLQAEAARPFDLAKDVMLRILLIRLSEHDHLLLHTSHHIAWDLKSKEIFYQELAHNYAALASGSTPNLPELPVQYADYAVWQKRFLSGKVLQQLEDYWKGQLAGAPAKLELARDHARPPIQTLKGAKLPVSLPEDLLAAVRAISLKLRVTPFMTLLAVFNAFLYAKTGLSDFSVGSPVLGREQEEIEPLIGFFINTVVMRTQFVPQCSLQDLIGKVAEVTLGAVAHQALPFDKVVEAIRPERDLSRMPLFQVNFRVQGPMPRPFKAGDIVFNPPEFVDSGNSKFDLSLELPMQKEGHGYWEYSTDLFTESTIRQMANDFDKLLRELLAHAEVPLDQLATIQEIQSRGHQLKHTAPSRHTKNRIPRRKEDREAHAG